MTETGHGSETLDSLTVRAVTAADWSAFERLLDSRGAPKNCWCMAWRASTEDRNQFGKATGSVVSGGRAQSSALRKTAMRSRILSGVPVGLLAFAGDQPVAWCSIAPRPTCRRLGGPKDFDDDPEAVWSIACFFVVRTWRGRGLSQLLIREAVDYARANGARIVEAYPVEPDSPSYRLAAGFDAVGSAGQRRTVMRRSTTGTDG